MPGFDALLDWLRLPSWGNPRWRWAAAAAAAVAMLFLLWLLRRLIRTRLTALAARTRTKADDVIAAVLGKTHFLSLLALSMLTASLLLEVGPQTVVFKRMLLVVALFQVGLWGGALLEGIAGEWARRKDMDPSSQTILAAASFFGKLTVWAGVVLVALDNFGVKVTTLVAGLGVGGIAAALAVQNILGDLFASVTILLDRPFEIGDFIIVGDQMGTVERIGLKSTRVRSLSGEQLIFSNNDLLSSRIRNFKRMFERRVVFNLGVTYDTPTETVERIPQILKDIVAKQPNTRLDRAHFAKMGDWSLNFEVVYYMTVPDYNAYMDAQQAINLEILKRFRAEGIQFAFPTQTLHLEKTGKA